MPAKKKNNHWSLRSLNAQSLRSLPHPRRWAVVAGALIIGAMAVSWQTTSPAADEKAVAQNKPSAAHVGVNAVITEARKQTVPVIGRLVARQAGVVAARTRGPVEEVHVEVGDRVKRGDVIAVLVKDLLKWQYELQKAEVDQYAAAVGTKDATTKLRRQQLKRIQRLIKSAAFSQARLDDKKQEVAVAESQAREAAAQLARAKANRNMLGRRR